MIPLKPQHYALTPLTWDPDLLTPLEMDGYLTGTLLTPDLEASQWVLGLWAEAPNLADDSRVTQALTTVLARRKAIEAELQQGWPAFHPSFCAAEPGQKADHGKVREWVNGFWKAMRLDPQYWSDLGDDDRTAAFIGLFAGFIPTDAEIDERDDADEIRDEHAALLPRALVGLRKLALLREKDATALRSIQANKVGRNQPCPCGSGKKFKRCCGMN
jgi:uncharacterized protein